MICTNCGAEIGEESAFCSACGHLVAKEEIAGGVAPEEESPSETVCPEETEKAHRKLPYSSIFLASLALILVIGSLIYFTQPIVRFKRAFASGDFENAQVIYKESTRDIDPPKKEKLDTKITEIVLERVKNLADEYAKNPKISNEKAQAALSFALQIGPVKNADLFESQSLIQKIDTSRSAYKQAQHQVKEKDFIAAGASLKLVVKEDALYDKATKQFESLKSDIVKQALTESAEFYKSESVDSAIEKLITATSIVSNSRLQAKLNEYTKEKSDQEARRKKELEATRDRLLGKMVKVHDSVDDTTLYKPKGYGKKTHTISLNRAFIYPYLAGDPKSEVPFFKISVGYNRSDWLFMNNLKFKAGSHRFDIAFNTSDVWSDVGFGTGVFEAIDILYTADNPLLSDSLEFSSNDTMLDDLRILANSKHATMRIEGSQANKDVTLTSKQLRDLRNFIKLYDTCVELYGE